MLLSSRSNDLVATVVVLMILFRIFVSSPRYRWYCDRSYFDDVRRLEYRVFSAAVSSLSDVDRIVCHFLWFLVLSVGLRVDILPEVSWNRPLYHGEPRVVCIRTVEGHFSCWLCRHFFW